MHFQYVYNLKGDVYIYDVRDVGYSFLFLLDNVHQNLNLKLKHELEANFTSGFKFKNIILKVCFQCWNETRPQRDLIPRLKPMN